MNGTILYFKHSLNTVSYTHLAESWYGCCADISQEKTALEFLSIFSKPVYSYYNGIIYMYINGAVVYSDAVTPGTWYDTGIRYASIDYGQACLLYTSLWRSLSCSARIFVS